MCDTFDSHLPPHASISLAFSASIFAKTCWGGGGGIARGVWWWCGLVVVWGAGGVLLGLGGREG